MVPKFIAECSVRLHLGNFGAASASNQAGWWIISEYPPSLAEYTTGAIFIPMQRFLIIAGVILVALGVGWPWISRLPFGRLPGDIHVVRDGFSFHFPIVTCLLISVLLTILISIFRR